VGRARKFYEEKVGLKPKDTEGNTLALIQSL
jgi:hypothetical protein